MHWIYDDGGRAAAGYVGRTGDCVTRAIAIATHRSYQQVYDEINKAAHGERTGTKTRGVSSARLGVYKRTTRAYLAALGWTWTPTMQIGAGCTVNLTAGELPKGRIIVSVSKHLTAVLDGVIHDTHDPSRGGRRCVYGYWRDTAEPTGACIGCEFSTPEETL
jgi:hypothetical protein